MIEKIKALGTKEKLWLMAGAIFLVDAFLGWQFLLKRDLQMIRLSETRIFTSQKKQAIFSEIAATENQLKKYQSFLSKSSEVEWLIETVNQLVSDTGLILISASPQPLKGGTDVHRISLSLEAAGGFHGLGKFLEKIENNSPFIKIYNLRLERGQGPAGQQGLHVTLLLSAYCPATRPAGLWPAGQEPRS